MEWWLWESVQSSLTTTDDLTWIWIGPTIEVKDKLADHAVVAQADISPRYVPGPAGHPQPIFFQYLQDSPLSYNTLECLALLTSICGEPEQGVARNNQRITPVCFCFERHKRSHIYAYGMHITTELYLHDGLKLMRSRASGAILSSREVWKHWSSPGAGLNDVVDTLTAACLNKVHPFLDIPDSSVLKMWLGYLYILSCW